MKKPIKRGLAAAVIFGFVSVSMQSSAIEPATVAAIAKAAWDVYSQTAEGQCVQLAASCGKYNSGAVSKCHEVRRRIGRMIENPTVYNNQQVYDITRSDRTQCMMEHFMGNEAWQTFEASQ